MPTASRRRPTRPALSNKLSASAQYSTTARHPNCRAVATRMRRDSKGRFFFFFLIESDDGRSHSRSRMGHRLSSPRHPCRPFAIHVVLSPFRRITVRRPFRRYPLDSPIAIPTSRHPFCPSDFEGNNIQVGRRHESIKRWRLQRKWEDEEDEREDEREDEEDERHQPHT